MKRPISVKPDTCTEGMDVNAAGISVKVACLTQGGLSTSQWLRVARVTKKSWQKSAEAILAELTIQ